MLLTLLFVVSGAQAQVYDLVYQQQKISDAKAGLRSTLHEGGRFGQAVTPLGDVNGDGMVDLAVGAPSAGSGTVHILLLHNTSFMIRGKVKPVKAEWTIGGAGEGDAFGRGVAGLGDLDGDGTPDLAVGAPGADEGGTDRGAVSILFLNPDGTVKREQKISGVEGGFGAALDDGDAFGASVAALGDVNDDGIMDIAVGAEGDDDGGSFGGQGAVYVLFLNADGTVKAHQKISATEGGLTAPIGTFDFFGQATAGLGDLDGDGTPDLAVGSRGDVSRNDVRGRLYILFLNANGTVKSAQTITNGEGGLGAPLKSFDVFSRSVAAVGDLDGDGRTEIAVGASGDDDGETGSGAVYLVYLNQDGSVEEYRKVSNFDGGLETGLDEFEFFGTAVAGLGDVNGDGIPDLVAGAPGYDDERGAVYILWLDPENEVQACADSRLRITAFRTSPDTQEFVDIQNEGDEPVLLDRCSVAFFDGVTHQAYYVSGLRGTIASGATFRLGSSHSRSDQTFAQGTLQKGPGGITVLEKTASEIFPGMFFFEVEDDVLAAVIFDERDRIVEASPAFAGGRSVTSTFQSTGDATTSTASGVAGHELGSAYPNPFNPVTTIRFTLREDAKVRLTVFDLTGRRVAVLAEGFFAAGDHAVQFDAGSLPSGMYLYRLEAGGVSMIKRMTLLK